MVIEKNTTLNVEELRKNIVELIKIPKLAKKLGITKQSLYNKFNNESNFTFDEVIKIVKILNEKTYLKYLK